MPNDVVTSQKIQNKTVTSSQLSQDNEVMSQIVTHNQALLHSLAKGLVHLYALVIPPLCSFSLCDYGENTLLYCLNATDLKLSQLV